MSTHPPIPPGSKYFRPRNDGGFDFILEAMAMPLSDNWNPWRDLIAKVAAQEWADEAERRKSAYIEACNDAKIRPDSFDLEDEWVAAQVITRGWRAWGRGEWKPK